MTIARRALIAALALPVSLTLAARNARAQGVPLLSGDLDFGSGATSAHAGGSWFRSASASMSNVDLAVRIGNAGATRPVVVVGYSFSLFPNDQLTNCLLAPNGSCEDYFPRTTGLSLGAGVRQALGEWALIGATAGVASYSGSARFAELDASLRVIPHLAIVGEFRYIDMAFGAQRVWFHPLMFGARLSW